MGPKDAKRALRRGHKQRGDKTTNVPRAQKEKAASTSLVNMAVCGILHGCAVTPETPNGVGDVDDLCHG